MSYNFAIVEMLKNCYKKYVPLDKEIKIIIKHMFLCSKQITCKKNLQISLPIFKVLNYDKNNTIWTVDKAPRTRRNLVYPKNWGNAGRQLFIGEHLGWFRLLVLFLFARRHLLFLY